MKNIEFVDKFTLQFNKPWSEKEKDVAACVGMKLKDGLITADTRTVSPHSVKDFIMLAFPTIMMSERDKYFKQNLFNQLRTIYKGIYDDFLENYYSKTSYERELFKHQKKSLSLMIHRQYNLLSFEQGLGKAQDVDSYIVTPLGVKRFGDISPGDNVISSNGESCNVLAIHPQGIKECYRVTFSDETFVECCNDHLWIVNDRSTLYTTGNPKVMRTAELRGNLLESNGRLKYSIPKTSPVRFNRKDTPVDPYLLGLLLGDGSFRNTVNYSTDDKDLIPAIQSVLPRDMEIKKTAGNNYSYEIVDNESYNKNKLRDIIRSLNLYNTYSHNKFIPDIYKYNSVENRLSILQGLLDSDGHINKSGNRISYTSTSNNLSKDLKFLVESLGGLCNIRTSVRKEKRDCHYMSIILPKNVIPFRLKRRLNRYKPKERIKRRMITSIVKVSDREQMCISVDSPDHSYLTNNFIVTHNTITSATLSKMLGVIRTIIIAPAGVKWNWYHDMTDEWGYDKMLWTILDAKKSKCVYAFDERFVVVNYESIPKHMNHLIQFNAGHIIIDECQKIKNTKTRNFKSVDKLVKHFPQARVTLLSGTPITNRVNDIFAYFKLCNHPLGFNYSAFLKNYTITMSGRGGNKVVGAKNVDELRMKISNFMIRKRTEECIDLPALMIKKYYFEMGDVKGEYEEHIEELYQHKKDLEMASSNKEKAQIKVKIKGNIHNLNRLLSTSKVNNVIPLIDQLVENGRDVIVFSGYTNPILNLEKHYGDSCVKVVGGMDSHKKNKAIQIFVNDPNCNVFLGNFKAAGVGINLVNARDVIFLNFPFTPDDLEQPYKRAHRIGQEKDVNVYYTIVKDSIDEHIFDMIVGKTKDINSILDDGKSGVVHYNQIPNDLFNRLISDYEKKNNINQKGGFTSVK